MDLLVANCSHSHLSHLPTSLPKRIDWLLLSNNNIANFSTEKFDEFDNIKYFCISHNNITSIVGSIHNMDSLKHLDMSYNSLESLPQSRKENGSLIHLSLSHNKFELFPLSVLNITSLTNLDLAYNKIISLPRSIQKMTQLTHLNVSHNNIMFLPNTIKNIPALKDIRIAFNKFICKCDLVWLKYWISRNMDIMKDRMETTCKIGSNRFTHIHIMPEREMGCIKPNYYIPSWIIPCKSTKSHYGKVNNPFF